MSLFLQGVDMYSGLDPAFGADLLGLWLGMLIFTLLIAVVIYVYVSLAFMAIARKVNYPSPGIAWIPGIGPAIIASKTANMHWWPILLLIGTVIPFIGFVFSIAFMVFFIIWLWKTFEVMNKPGWWAILMIIPIVGLILLGIAAWGRN
jgi:hypothetical protein